MRRVEHQLAKLIANQVRRDLREAPERLRRDGALARCRNVADLRRLHRRRVPKAIFDFVDGAAGDEVTALRNRSDLERVTLAPRVLVDVAEIDLRTTVLGQPIARPFLAAPTGLTGLTHHRGELAVALAAHAHGTVSTLSAMASYTIEEIAAGAPGPRWFQLYMWRDRGLVSDLIARARAAGYRALVLTVDVPVAGARERDWSNGFGIPPRMTLRSLAEGALRPRWSRDFIAHPRMEVANAAGHGGGPADASSLTEYINAQYDPTLTWSDLDWVRGQWDGPLVIKGVLRADDALLAARAGASAIVVSNHAGRQLDHAPSTISALPAIVDAAGDDLEVYFDGGIRRGVDIVKALAVGARACLIGRALLYGLGAGGDAGALRSLDILTEETRRAMALLGCRSVAELDRSWLRE